MPQQKRRESQKRKLRQSKTAISRAVSVADFEVLAERRVARMAWDYISGAAADEITLRRNREAFNAISLLPRVLCDVSQIETSLELFGTKLPFPVLLAPVAYHKLVHCEGELATARGASACGVTMVASSFATVSIEEIARVATAPLWFQLYVHPDRGFTRELIARAESSGCQALCVTVDTPIVGTRNREERCGFQLPSGLAAEHLKSLGSTAAKISHIATNQIYTAALDPSLTWLDIDWLRSQTKLPLILKGILAVEDARLAVEHGAAGIVVSNHGGRNLDTTPATIDALPRIADAIAGRTQLLLDGGVRRGTDVLKAIALGAQAVLIGRPYIWGLATAGAEGVTQVLEIFRSEFLASMALCGTTSLSAITREVLWGRNNSLPRPIEERLVKTSHTDLESGGISKNST